jgi:D-glycero-D-manno-heptose 1,7-bisphosphate phosphatase
MALTQGIFLDKDGTLLEDVPYNVNPALMRFAPGVAAGLRRLAKLGLPLIVVSNQPGVALGLFEEQALERVQNRLARMFESVGARLTGFYYCRHHPAGVVPHLSTLCTCRKPQAGMLMRAAEEHRIDLSASWMIGDILNDVEAGRRAGCETILINNGNETEWLAGPLRTPHHVVDDFDQASKLIFGSDALNAVPLEPGNDIASAAPPFAGGGLARMACEYQRA